MSFTFKVLSFEQSPWYSLPINFRLTCQFAAAWEGRELTINLTQ